MFDDIITSIKEWSRKQKLIERALDSCRITLQNCAIDEAELFPNLNTGADILRGYKISEIQLQFDKQSLVFKHDLLPYSYVETQIGLYIADPTDVYLRGLEPIGTYRFIVNLDGKINDDYLILDKELYIQK